MLRVEQLHKRFGGVVALADLSLELPKCGATAIIGPNGSGKTTLLNVITGFLRPDTGRCFYNTEDITRLAPHRIARLGLRRTFQELRLIRRSTCIDNILLTFPNQSGENLTSAILRVGVASEQRKNRGEALVLLSSVGLENKALDLADQMSYGEQKLLSLLCCIAGRADTFLLDEPFSGIHPELALRMDDMLRSLADKEKLIVFVEHDISAVRRLAHQVVVMDQGAVIAQGVPREILECPDILEAYLA